MKNVKRAYKPLRKKTDLSKGKPQKRISKVYKKIPAVPAT